MADDCALAMLRLREQLRSRWPDRMFFSGAENMSILSLSTGLTVWGLRGAFVWNEGGRVVRYPLHDVSGVVDHLLTRAGLLRGLGWPPGGDEYKAAAGPEEDADGQLAHLAGPAAPPKDPQHLAGHPGDPEHLAAHPEDPEHLAVVPELPGQLALLPTPASVPGGAYRSVLCTGAAPGHVSTMHVQGLGPAAEEELSQAAS